MQLTEVELMVAAVVDKMLERSWLSMMTASFVAKEAGRCSRGGEASWIEERGAGLQQVRPYLTLPRLLLL